MSPPAKPATDELKKSLKEAVSTVKDLVAQGDLPKAVVAQAKGLVFLASTKVGLGLSANAGSGIVLSRLGPGSWSAPLPLTITGVGFGAVLGYEEQRTLIGLALHEDLDVFKVVSGGQMSLDLGATFGTATTGPLAELGELGVVWGAGPENTVKGMTLKHPSAVRIFTLSKGVLLDVSLAGTNVDLDVPTLNECYGAGMMAAHVLEGKVEPPPEAQELYAALRAVVDGRATAP